MKVDLADGRWPIKYLPIRCIEFSHEELRNGRIAGPGAGFEVCLMNWFFAMRAGLPTASSAG